MHNIEVDKYVSHRRSGIGDKPSDPYYLAINPRIKHLRAFVFEKKGILIDIGCGEMPFKQFIMESSDIDHYCGLDILQNRSGTVNVLTDCATKLPIMKKCADIVFLNSVLEHVNEPFDVLKESYRVLKNDGYVYVYVPFMWQEHEEPYDYFRFTRFGLRYLLEKSEFQVTALHTAGGFYSVMGMMFRQFLGSNKKIGFFGKVLRKGINLKIVRAFYNLFFASVDNLVGSDNPTIGFGIIGHKTSTPGQNIEC